MKRMHPLPRDPMEALTRTIVVENLPDDATEQSIKLLCEPVGLLAQRHSSNEALLLQPGTSGS